MKLPRIVFGLLLVLCTISVHAGTKNCAVPPEILSASTYEPTVQILTPSPNLHLHAGRVVVTGTYRGPANTGVTVNDVVAVTDGHRFYANHVPVHEGVNTITAIATTPYGMVAKDTVTAHGVGSEALELRATRGGIGVAPYKIAFKVLYTGKTKVQSASMDFNGDGAVDAIASDLKSKFEFTYTSPGVYSAQITVTDIEGKTYQATYTVHVIDSAAADSQFQATYSAFIDALACEDIVRATSYLTVSARERYRPVFGKLKSQLRRITSSFSPLRPSIIAGQYAEYGINRTIDGINRIFLIYFVQDNDGVWRIDSM